MRPGPKPKTKTRENILRSLMQLAPAAMKRIEALMKKDELTPGEQRVLDNAWQVIEHTKGKAPACIELGGEGSLESWLDLVKSAKEKPKK